MAGRKKDMFLAWHPIEEYIIIISIVTSLFDNLVSLWLQHIVLPF